MGCGVIVYYSENPTREHLEMLKKIFYQSKIRGLHAFGFVVSNGNGFDVKKDLILDNIFAAMEESAPFTTFIGHARYTTCEGDWNMMENNQPIVIDNIALAFNGVISMKTKQEYEKEFDRTYATGNDGEIFLKHMVEGNDPVKFFDNKPYSFAGAWIKDKKVFVFRNAKRPLWCLKLPDAVFVASTRDIFKRALGDVQARSLAKDKVMTINDIECRSDNLSYEKPLGSARVVYLSKVNNHEQN